MAKKFFRDVDTAAERRNAHKDINPRTWHGRDLDPDEVVLWRGRPQRGIAFTVWDVFVIPASLVWSRFALLPIFGTQASVPLNRRGDTFHRLLFGFLGVYIVFGRFLVDAMFRSRLTYVVTDRRVMIINGLPAPFGGVRSYDRHSLRVVLHEQANGRGTIELRTDSGWSYWLGNRDVLHAALQDVHRLFRIRDARHVYRVLTDRPT